MGRCLLVFNLRILGRCSRQAFHTQSSVVAAVEVVGLDASTAGTVGSVPLYRLAVTSRVEGLIFGLRLTTVAAVAKIELR